LQRAAAAHKKIGGGDTIKNIYIYNGVLKSMSDNACSVIDSLKKEKRMLPEDDPVRLQHVVNVF
jgi:hypothetical protein